MKGTQTGSFREVAYLIHSDVYRYHGRCNKWLVLRDLCSGIGCRYMIWTRLCLYFQSKGVWFRPWYVVARLFQRSCMFKFGIDIPHTTRIGPGFYIGHFGTIVVSDQAVIGRNCNISPGVTIGAVFRGPRSGAPVIGDNVYLGPGSKVVGKVTIGSNVAIGANCVVTRDVPDHAVVVGIPGKVISENGSEGYILHADYDRVWSGNYQKTTNDTHIADGDRHDS
jgi:serine O-acetyltransferase